MTHFQDSDRAGLPLMSLPIDLNAVAAFPGGNSGTNMLFLKDELVTTALRWRDLITDDVHQEPAGRPTFNHDSRGNSIILVALGRSSQTGCETGARSIGFCQAKLREIGFRLLDELFQVTRRVYKTFGFAHYSPNTGFNLLTVVFVNFNLHINYLL
ncbi:hypothetical protein XM53_17590 [Roseovarius atlanticus]|uniref:Uncharacterized protein n=1 Tax=Roseovarius atlanticus TaxID=1641875 RepID=A0A0T5NQ32_9RHOB|nr:hypothetical protein XM53_17590 [Roseovarius atlanticus]